MRRYCTCSSCAVLAGRVTSRGRAGAECCLQLGRTHMAIQAPPSSLHNCGAWQWGHAAQSEHEQGRALQQAPHEATPASKQLWAQYMRLKEAWTGAKVCSVAEPC